jgi:hypothetical protein
MMGDLFIYWIIGMGFFGMFLGAFYADGLINKASLDGPKLFAMVLVWPVSLCVGLIAAAIVSVMWIVRVSMGVFVSEWKKMAGGNKGGG